MNKYTHGGVNHIDATVHFFDSPGQIEWYWRLFKKRFWHVAVTLHGSTPEVHRSVTVDPRMPYIDVFGASARHVGETNVRFRNNIPLSAPPWGFLVPATCVTVVKGVLGIRARWVLTPYQLYKYLLKNGGVEK